jgi:carbonic anhydrase/acetyltransferase-like protein (isoleucine patch superfamily)
MFTRSQKSSINIGRYCIIESGVTILGCFMEDYVQIMEGTLIYEESSIGEGSIIVKNSQVPPGLIIPARSVLRGIPVEPIREQSRNEVLKQKDRAEHYSQLFMKIKEQLPNAQSYLLTLPDFIKLLFKKEN